MPTLDVTKRPASRARSQLLGSSLATAGLQVGARALGFVTALMLAAVLGAAGYGAYAWAIALVTVIRVPLTLGRDRLLVRQLAAHVARSEWGAARGVVTSSTWAVVGASVAFTVLAEAALALVATASPFVSALRVGLVLVPIATLTATAQGALQGLQRVVRSQLPDALLRPLVFLALTAVLAIVAGDPTPEEALALQAVAAAAALVVTAGLLARNLPKAVRAAAPRYERASWNRSGLTMAANAGFGVVGQRIDLILVGVLMGASSAGGYGLAVAGASLAALPVAALALPLSPAVAELHAKDERGGLARLITSSTRWTLLATVAVAGALALAGPFGLRLLGGAFGGGAGALALLCVAGVVNAAFATNGLVLVMSGEERAATLATAAGAASNALLCVVLIPLWGLEGAATAVVASVLIRNALASYFTWSRLALDSSFVGRRPPPGSDAGRRAPPRSEAVAGSQPGTR
jgi:O-antigen/teichoic acid export membrane protein